MNEWWSQQGCGNPPLYHDLARWLRYCFDDTVTLSVGQKQLLTIARALLKDAPLDFGWSDIFSRHVQRVDSKAMDRLMEGRTLSFAHRLSTIRNADLILVMKDGNIIEQGNHEELMAQGGFTLTCTIVNLQKTKQKNKSKEAWRPSFSALY